jgi:ribosomal RNA assembly protein
MVKNMNKKILFKKTLVSLISDLEASKIAKKAIMMLIDGLSHSTVYQFLYKKRRELKQERTNLWKPTPS